MNLTIFVVLATIVGTNAFNTLTPWDQEVTYNWRALVKAGTHLPTPYASQFALQGKIHLQSNNNSTFVKITDLNYQLYNGILDHVHEHKANDIPLPQEVQDLNNVFKIVYDEDGLATGIATEADEKDFSRNIKKAIATILQMKKSVVDRVYKRSEAFVIKENSIYGHGLVDYTVIPHDDDVVEVLKMHDMPNSYDLYSHFVTNTEPGRCDVNFEHMVMHDSTRKYIIVKKDGHHVPKEITATGAIVYYPFKAQSDSQYISVNQTFSLVDIVPIKQHFHIQQEHFESDLTYHTSEDGVDADVASGRHVVNYDKLIPLVRDMLKDIPQYLQENHINTEEPDSKRGQLVNRVQRLLGHFNVEKFEELQKTLSGDALKIFYHILPLVSTDASAIYFKNLIVKKLIDDDLAVTLLHRMSGNIAPSTHLLSQLEELIHLDTSFSWNLRKVAILTFGSLVHKSYIYTKKTLKAHEHPDEAYEKYVNEYMSNLKNSHEYKIQMVYIFGLHNMNLPSLIKHLVPTFNGELWADQHLRFLGLWSASGAILQSPTPDTIIETLWPIFANRSELTELRVLAFYYIMQTQPSHSRLRNIFTFLTSEPNYELYKFHYTYLQAVTQSTNPCRQEMRVKLAQVLKFTPPPVYGTSSANFYNYKDINYGFGAEMEQYFINTQPFRFHALMVNLQHFDWYDQEYMVYLKVQSDHPGRHTGANSLAETVASLLKSTGKERHVEAAILKRGQVKNVYYFNEDRDIQEFYDVVKPVKENKILTQEWLYMDYHWYHKALIPTDLGVPAQWEFLMPDVRHNNLTIILDPKEKNIVKVENKNVNWIHFRHGLSFYNPISDVWQGVNRFHSYDATLPLSFDVTLNIQDKGAQLSWKKNNDTSTTVAGLRSHVKQMVFIKDLYEQEDIVQATPHRKNFQIVSHGKQYRHDYTLMDEDSLDWGHTYMGIYDSEVHVSNGSFKHQMNLFTQTDGKHFNSLNEYLLLTFYNFLGYVGFLPVPGTHGFIFKIEPSHNHPVSNIDLIFRSETDDQVFNFSGSYVVKNEDQILKTWNLSMYVHQHSGAALSNFAISLTRVVPGQKNFKICFDGYKTATFKDVNGHFSVSVSDADHGPCSIDDNIIDVTMTAQRSPEQKDGHYKHGSCQYTTPYSIPHHKSLQCLISRTTVRHYVYDVKTLDIPNELKTTVTSLWDHFKGNYLSYYIFDNRHNENISHYEQKIDVQFPLQGDEVDIRITTPQYVHEFSGIPAGYGSPESVAFPTFSSLQSDEGWFEQCRIYPGHIYSFTGKLVSQSIPSDDWKRYIDNENEYLRIVIFLKQVNNTIAMKIHNGDRHVEILPEGGSYRIFPKPRAGPELKAEDWVYYQSEQEIGIILGGGIYVNYNVHEVILLIFKRSKMSGYCVDISH